METFVWWIVSMILSYAISLSMAPKIENPRPAATDEFDFPQFDEGTPQCVVFGDCWVEDWMVIGMANFRSVPIMGKGGR